MEHNQNRADRTERFGTPKMIASWRLFCGSVPPRGEKYIHCYRCALVFWGPERLSIRETHERAAHGIR